MLPEESCSRARSDKFLDFATPTEMILLAALGRKDPRIDAYIDKSAKFAKPIEWLAQGKPRNWKYMPARK